MPDQTRREFLKSLGAAASTTLASGIAAAAGNCSEIYARTVLAETGLLGYWRLEGDLKDAKARANGKALGGPVTFAPGPEGGAALSLGRGRFVSMGPTPHLDTDETTVEFFFRLPVPPTARYNPCLLAKRRSPSETRFSIHVMRDLENLAAWNGRRVSLLQPPEKGIEVGRWYHLVVASSRRGLAAWLDGVPCEIRSAAPFNVAAKRYPLQLGASTPRGDEQCVCLLDEVAIYGRVLSADDVVRHVAAIGWDSKRRRIVATVKREKQALERRRAEDVKKRMNDPTLFERGETRVYAGEHLTAISLPVGGIGAGVIQIDGRAVRHAWQIFNNFSYAYVPNTFFALRAAAEGETPVTRVLQTKPEGPFQPMTALTFRGEYPFGWFDFQDRALPVHVSLEVFNPLIPLNTKDSAIPCAIFGVTVKNASDRKTRVELLGTQLNAIGFAGVGEIEKNRHPAFGGNVNRVITGADATFLHMTSTKHTGSPGDGDMALAIVAEHAHGVADWKDLQSLAKTWGETGELSGPSETGPTTEGQSVQGALGTSFDLQPGEQRTVSFVLTWHFPKAHHGSDRPGWVATGNMYANWWPNALAVAEDVVARLDELVRLTRLYHDSVYESNLPHWLVDRMTSQVAVLRSKTCFWGGDGYFGAWEGCNRGSGCCYGNCSHVWHYAQSHAWLFPEIARRMREEALRFQQDNGAIPFRQPRNGIACDAQVGEVLEAYREHLLSANGDWLHANWPRIKKAMDFAIDRWDSDEDGVLAGPQHNTLDCEIGGSSSWLGTLYLAALAASEQMASIEGDKTAARRYRAIRESGMKKQNETLWNGEYYIQIPDPQPHRDYNTGCHIDQVLGQWWAHQLGLGWLYPPDRVRKALQSLMKYNFKGNFHGIVQVPRKFVDDDDAGMQMITWPHGGRPENHTLYADEVMSGFEYSAACAMLQAGLMREAFVVVKAIYDRYDGRARPVKMGGEWGESISGNPFGDDECGRFYARAMSNWSLLLACQGIVFDGPSGRLGFKPLWRPADHVSFFSAPESWGVFSQKREVRRQTERLDIRFGRLIVRELVFEVPEGASVGTIHVALAGKRLDAMVEQKGREVRISFGEPIEVLAQRRLDVVLQLG